MPLSVCPSIDLNSAAAIAAAAAAAGRGGECRCAAAPPHREGTQAQWRWLTRQARWLVTISAGLRLQGQLLSLLNSLQLKRELIKCECRELLLAATGKGLEVALQNTGKVHSMLACAIPQRGRSTRQGRGWRASTSPSRVANRCVPPPPPRAGRCLAL